MAVAVVVAVVEIHPAPGQALALGVTVQGLHERGGEPVRVLHVADLEALLLAAVAEEQQQAVPVVLGVGLDAFGGELAGRGLGIGFQQARVGACGGFAQFLGVRDGARWEQGVQVEAGILRAGLLGGGQRGGIHAEAVLVGEGLQRLQQGFGTCLVQVLWRELRIGIAHAGGSPCRCWRGRAAVAVPAGGRILWGPLTMGQWPGGAMARTGRRSAAHHCRRLPAAAARPW